MKHAHELTHGLSIKGWNEPEKNSGLVWGTITQLLMFHLWAAAGTSHFLFKGVIVSVIEILTHALTEEQIQLTPG